MESNSSNVLVKVSNIEKQLWASVNSKGLLHPEVRNLYNRVCSSYEKATLKKASSVNFQEVEFSLWKLHYKHIDEFRRQIKKGSSGSSGHLEGLKLFLLNATEFYKSLLLKLRTQRIPKVRFEENPESQFLCHRFLICLGDLARYRELFEKNEVESRNWSVAASHYLEASKIWPESGNPHNQLALLATYIGDEFLALYHFVRSLAIKDPFPDARNNLIFLLEKSRSSPLFSDPGDVSFDFSRPSQRINSSKPDILKEGLNCSEICKLWPLIVKTASFFYIGSSFDEFPRAFASTIRELETLIELNDAKLEEALRSYHFAGSTNDAGPTRSVQAVCTFIFIIHNLPKNPTLENPEQRNRTGYAVSSAFIFMGRVVDRCSKSRPVDSSPLLPSVLIFIEWLVNALDYELDLHRNNNTEEERAAVSYFFGRLVRLLNVLRIGELGLGSRDRAALWEDSLLRDFSPLEKSHTLLDFSASSPRTDSFGSGNISRAWRILSAAKRIAEGSDNWLLFNKSTAKFSTTAKVEEEKQIMVDEEEVILFKPLTRYNSAPIYDHSFDEEDVGRMFTASDERLRRTQTAAEFTPSSAFSAGPPSLSGWVLNGEESSGIGEEKNRLPPIEELASISFDNLSVKASEHENRISDSSLKSVITHYPLPPPPPYSAPIPSAPLIPEDAAWFSGAHPSSADVAPNRFMNLAYPATPGLSSSEWLRKFREINNLRPLNGQILGNFNTGPILFDSSNQGSYLSPKPLLYPEYYPLPSYGCGGLVENPARDDQVPLLQYLKEREWRLQQDPSFRGPTFLGN